MARWNPGRVLVIRRSFWLWGSYLPGSGGDVDSGERYDRSAALVGVAAPVPALRHSTTASQIEPAATRTP